MSEPRVIRADYSNWRPVAGRKVLQLILEVPIEQTADVMEKLGFPLPGESKWVAVALLESGKPASENEGGKLARTQKPSDGTAAPATQTGQEPSPTTAITAKAGTSEIHNKDRRPFASLPLSQQAAIRCGDADFWRFAHVKSGVEAADFVRAKCNIGTRAALDDPKNIDPIHFWHAIEAGYQQYLTTQRYASVAR